ncbi:MAG: PEP-CTERM sorting domain-containing protein [Lentisphaerae bacterium]|nr:PEP-CTERM sorting domain-containing protein [Lentisphaerota bacterium]
MKNKLLLAVLIGMGWVSASQAVIITWAAETTGPLVGSFTTAQLFWVPDGTWNYEEYTGNAYTSVDTASGFGVGSGIVYDNIATDVDRTQGAYFVVLFDGVTPTYRSIQSLAWNDTGYNAFAEDGMAPATGLFMPTGGAVWPEQTGDSGWRLVPEPNTFALLALGAAALAARRRRKL